ncbi:MAG: redoxin domain-containing protein [Candidatus Poribacteria bacterium]|nr:redoxin domain-containing protein [Candidatus Poribacteria bacterium]
MRAILTVAIVLGLLITSANADTPAEKQSEDLMTEQHEKNIEICTQNLVAIGKAVEAYKKEHGDFPEWLSELHPKYLPEANLLLCPADEECGKPLLSSNADPKMSVSYDYQFHPENREGKNEERLVYGDVTPLVRCFHHLNEDFEDRLNLSFSLNIYRLVANWKYVPEDMYGSHKAAITAFENALSQHPDDRRFFDLYPRLVVLYTKVGNEKSADALIERFKSPGMIPDNNGYRSVHRKLKGVRLYEELLEIFKAAEQRQPDEGVILVRLADIYEKLGNTELAEVYYRKSDPKYELWGKPVTDFSVTDLDGKPISLQDYRGKVVLLDFWGVWCGFCIDEMPNLKRVYATYKDQGFDIIGVSLDDKESALRDYIKENDIQWRQIYSGERWENDPIAQQFTITGVPEQWLIDRDGKLITHKARGEKLEGLVVEALKKKAESK